MKSTNIGVALYLILAVIALRLLRPVPILGVFADALLPTAFVAMLAAIAGSLAMLSGRRGAYWIAALATVTLLTWAGVFLRIQAEASGRAGVFMRSDVSRVVQARLREPVALASDASIRYDEAPYDAFVATCESYCMMSGGLKLDASLAVEVPARLLEDIGVKPQPPEQESRVRVRIQQVPQGDRVDIIAEVTDAGTRTATWHARLPLPGRAAKPLLSPWMDYLLQQNPLAAMLKPRPRLGDQLLGNFLRSAIRTKRASPAADISLQAREVEHQVLTPPLRVDRMDPRYRGQWYRSRDTRCDGVVSVEVRPGVADAYVTFLALPEAGPQLRLRNEQLICAGDAVYVQRYRRTPSDILNLVRYTLDGQHAANLHIRIPRQAFSDFIAFDLQSVVEQAGTLEFDVRHVAFEWARDTQGHQIKREDGTSLQYAIVSREGHYAVSVPTAAHPR